MKIENADHIHAALRAKGLNARRWAIANGYNPRTVLHCIEMFAPNTGRTPKRALAKEIVQTLNRAIGLDSKGDDHA